MLISTTSSIEGKNVKEYRGVVFGEVINGVNIIKLVTDNNIDLKKKLNDLKNCPLPF